MRASYHTLGCKLNFSETSAIRRLMEMRGIGNIKKGEIPDICVVNTCSVTSVADKKARNLIRGLSVRYPKASIMVTGCYAQLKPDEVANLPGVEIVVGSADKHRLPEIIDKWLAGESLPKISRTSVKDIRKFHPACEQGERTRFFLKVQDGCDYYCSYCTIPFARGRSRSGKIEEMIALARDAASKGAREIVLTGVNVGEFGKDHTENFFDLIRALDKIKEIDRFRISSIEPNLLGEEILRWIARESRAFMPHFHIPLQSGSDAVLALMRRKYDTSLFSSRVEMIRDLIPDAFIGVDIIAGARGETTEEWEKSYLFARSIDVSKFHVFPYSERPGTKALLLGDIVSQEEKHRRVARLTELSEKKQKIFTEKFFGKERPVLWETKVKGENMQGHTDNYLLIEAPFREELINEISSVRISGFENSGIRSDERLKIIGEHIERKN